MNNISCRSPYQIMYGSSPKISLELRKMEQGERKIFDVEDFAKHVKNLHEDVHAHITKMNL